MIKGEKYDWKIFNDIITKYVSPNPHYKKVRYKNVKKDESFQNGLKQLYSNLETELNKMSVYDASNVLKDIAVWIEEHDEDFSLNKHPEKNFCDIGKIYSIEFGLGYRDELANYHRGLCIGAMGNKIGIIPMSSADNHDGKIRSVFESAYHPIENPKGDQHYYQALKKEGFPKDAILMIADTKFVSVGKVNKCNDVIKISPYLFRDIQIQVLFRMMPELAGHYKYLEELGDKEKQKYSTSNSNDRMILNQQNQKVEDSPTSKP